METRKLRSFTFVFLLTEFASFLSGSEIFSSIPDSQLDLSQVASMTVGDLNNDGEKDLIVSVFSENKRTQVVIFYNKNGIFDKTPSLELKSDFKSSVKLAIGDFDNDGKNDIAVNERKILHLFLGKDNFQNDISNYNVNSISNSFYQAKLIPGGKCDFISSGAIRKWLGENKWTYGYLSPPENSKAYIFCLPCDLNNDEKPDIIAITQEGNNICLYYGPFANIYIKPMDAAKFQLLNFERPAYLATGFLNDDENIDIAVSSSEKIGIFYQARPISFMKNEVSLSINCGGTLLIADFNGDKKDDLAVLDSKKRKIFIFLQKDNKFFPEKPEQADCVIPLKKDACFCSGDIDGNGLPDMIIGDIQGISVHLNKNK